jgi:hypothetical protein
MQCPSCGSTDHRMVDRGPHAFRRPQLKHGRTWRVHECKKCQKMFVSVQAALTPEDAQTWMDLFDAESDSMRQTAGSSSGQETGA